MDEEEILLSDDEDFLPVVPSVNSNKENYDNEESKTEELDIPFEDSNDEILDYNDTIFSEDKPIELPINDLSNQVVSNPVKIENNNDVSQPENKVVKEKIYKYSKILPVIAFLFVSTLGIYILVKNVKADVINLIKIEENSKVGYINDNGEVIVKPKFLYGSDFYSGYAIAKNYNNLYGIIDGKGNNEIPFGNIFFANLYGNKYIVSKFTNEGLKMGLLDSNLNEVTRFKYDNLTYSKSGVFIYTRDETMGIMNRDGKEIYSYKVDEVDDRNVSVEISNVPNKPLKDTYAKIKINSSSTIINLGTGKEVYKYTLDDIRVLDNNVFYTKTKGNNRYFIIKDDKNIYQTDKYKRIRVEDIDSNIAIGIKDDGTLDYINLLTKEVINSNDNIKYTYSNGVVLKETYNFQTNKNDFTVYTPNKTISNFSDIKFVDKIFVNDFAKIYTADEKYNYISKDGNILSNKEYDMASDFNENGYAIVSNDSLYGVIDSKGKEVIELKYDKIHFLDSEFFDNVYKRTNQKLFVFLQDNKYGIINSNGKIVLKPIYDDFKSVTTKYPFIKAKYRDEYVLINLITYKDLSIEVNNNIQIYDNYIYSNGNYYNYNGELIYKIGG